MPRGTGAIKRQLANQTGRRKTPTAKQKKLVDTVTSRGCSVAEAAAECNISVNNAYRDLRIPHVRQYLVERSSEAVVQLAPYAAHVMRGLITSARSEYVRLQAAQDILNRVYGKPVEKRQIEVSGRLSIRIGLEASGETGGVGRKPMATRNSTPIHATFPSASEDIEDVDFLGDSDQIDIFATNEGPSLPGTLREGEVEQS